MNNTVKESAQAIFDESNKSEDAMSVVIFVDSDRDFFCRINASERQLSAALSACMLQNKVFCDAVFAASKAVIDHGPKRNDVLDFLDRTEIID